MSFAARIDSKHSRVLSAHPVVLVRHEAQSNQPACWFFVQVVQAKLQAFRRALAGGACDLADYGTVLASGYGMAPPAKTLTRMQTFYGFKGE